MNPHVRGQFMKIKPGKDSPALSWAQEMPTSSSFFPLAEPPCWRALRQPCSSQPGRSPIIQKSPSPDGPEETKPASWSPSPVWRQSVLCQQIRGGFGAPCWPPEKSGQPRAQRAQRAHPEAALLWALGLEDQTEMQQNKLHDPPQNMAKKQSEPIWNAAKKRNTSESVLMKWLERIKQGSQSEREKHGI